MYRSISPDKIVETVRLLNKRIEERFPDSNIGRVCRGLCEIAEESKHRSQWIAKPNIGLRVGVAAVILLGISLLFYTTTQLEVSWGTAELGDLMQAVEAGMQNLFFMGVVIFFLVSVEVRIKRARALAAVHELRVIAHVIDMHQLTKDPSRLVVASSNTPSSPGSSMTVFELIRYLDYCTELLSLTGKVASMYAQNFADSVVVDAVYALENFTTGLSQKIWHKIVILHSLEDNKSALAVQTLKSGN